MENTPFYPAATPEHYEDMIDFCNMVFRIDFPALLPKLYAGKPQQARHHLLALEQGRIRGVVLSYPADLRVAGKLLHTRGIGTVSTHPRERGKGTMSRMLRQAEQEAVQSGADLMLLGGRRQRYERFGFAKVATSLEYRLTLANCRNTPEASTGGITAQPLEQHPGLTQACYELHRRQDVCAQRSLEEFADVLATWNSRAWVLLQDGVFLGYASVKQETSVVGEFILNAWSRTLGAAHALLLAQGGDSLLFAPLYPQQELILALETICENASTAYEGMVHVLNYPAVIEAFLTLKAQVCGIEDGTFVFEDQQAGRFEIRVEKGEVNVQETTRQPQISLPHIAMQRFLFCPTNPFRSASPLEKSWFPIPINIPEIDFV